MSERNRRSTNGNMMAQGYAPMQTNHRHSRRKSSMLKIVVTLVCIIAVAISLILILQPHSKPNERNVIIPVNASNSTDTNPRAKAWSLTKDEWMIAYNSYPSMNNTAPKIETMLNLTTSDYRTVYYSIVSDAIEVILMCEDTTSKVCALMLQVSAETINEKQLSSESVGAMMAQVLQRCIYACDKDLSQDYITIILQEFLSRIGSGQKNVFIFNNNKYTLSIEDNTIRCGINLNETFASEEEFLKYREGTTL